MAGPHRRHLGNAPDRATLGVVVRGFQRARRVGPLAGHAPASSRSRRDGHGWIWMSPDSEGGLLRPMPSGCDLWATGIHISKQLSSEERLVGQTWVHTDRFRWSININKKQKIITQN